jgi:hypothetical protein
MRRGQHVPLPGSHSRLCTGAQRATAENEDWSIDDEERLFRADAASPWMSGSTLLCSQGNILGEINGVQTLKGQIASRCFAKCVE